MRLVGIERSLSTSQRPIVLLPIFLDDAFERAVWHVAIPSPEQKQICQYARESAVSILKWMDRKKSHDENGDDQQRMMRLSFQLPVRPRHEFLHKPRGIEGTCSFKNDANTPAMFIKCLDVIGNVFIAPPVMLVTRGKLQQDPVELLDMVFRQRHFPPRIKHQARRLSVSGPFLFIPRP